MTERKKLRCNSCLGEYYNYSEEGSDYRHVCPEIPDKTVKGQGNNYVIVSTKKRPGHRDENIDKRTGLIKAEGQGVTRVK